MGAHTRQYLLEKSRVVQQAPSERNYHIFYAMCAGATAEQRAAWKLRDPATYAYLNHENRAAPGVDESARWKEVCESLDALRYTAQEQSAIFKLLSLVLALGDLAFTESDSGSSSIAPGQKGNPVRP